MRSTSSPTRPAPSVEAPADDPDAIQRSSEALSWEERWRKLVLGHGGGPGPAVARAGLWALSLLYGSIIAGYRAAYAWGLLKTIRADCRVISVGNLTVGGTGKSTTVRWLANWLCDRGVPAAVLSYGYRAASKDRVTVVSDGNQVLVPEAVSGDEPRMLAEALPGVPVLIGKRRQLSAAMAVREFGTRVCVLDDAFQYWRLARDLDVVLIDAICPFGGGHVLPRGLLRETPGQLKRAHVVIVTNSHRAVEQDRLALRQRLQRLAPSATLAEARHVPRALRPFDPGDGARNWLAEGDVPFPLVGQRVLALSSLGNPEGFERMLVELGAEVVPERYPDHHHYHRDDMARMAERARAAGCFAIVTTEKDSVKLDCEWFGSFCVWVLVVQLAFDAGEEELEARLVSLVD